MKDFQNILYAHVNSTVKTGDYEKLYQLGTR